MKRNRFNRYVFLTIIILFWSNLIAYAKPEEPPKVGVILPFKEKKLLSRKAVLITYFAHLKYMDVSRDNTFLRGPKLFEKDIPCYAGLASRPDGSMFYVASENGLMEFDSNMKLMKEVPLNLFFHDTNVWKPRYISDIKASNDMIWILVLLKPVNSGPWNIILEWPTKKRPQNRNVGPLTIADYFAVNSKKRIVFSPWTSSIYDFANQKKWKGGWPDYEFADYNPNCGLLLSVRPKDNPKKIILFNENTKSYKDICAGTWAVWGPNNTIYYTKGTTQLWRCKSDGSSQEPVYVAGPVPPMPSNGFGSFPPRFSYDKSFMAFQYYNPKSDNGGVILIDFNKEEYRILGKAQVGNDLTWLVKTKDLNANKKSKRNRGRE